MPISPVRVTAVCRIARDLLALVGALALVATLAFECLQSTWIQQTDLGPRESFFEGTIGTELIPLPVLPLLPELFPEHFQPAGAAAGDWVDQFGFLRSDRPDGLPIGFAISNRRPLSGAPSPVPFVGFSCALCHTSSFQEEGGAKRHVVVGAGSNSLNLVAWGDALQAATMDRAKFTLESFEAAHERRVGRGFTVAERAIVCVWIQGIRAAVENGFPRFDEPYGHGRSLEEDVTPTGPARTQPFRTIVRDGLNLPGSGMPVYTKFSAVFNEGWRDWAQVDGSVADLYARSAAAAFAAGATVQNMRVPEIVRNIRRASDFTRTLQAPTFASVFPAAASALDPAAVARGQAAYLRHCDACHGHPEGYSWVRGARTGEVVPYQEVGTDPARVAFRHYERIAPRLVEMFSGDHPFALAREKIRPGPAGTTLGYINAPIEGAFARAPFLHNASVPTLASLLHLEPRPAVFFRGRNFYDAAAAGLIAPDHATPEAYFRYDTRAPGNANHGHDYPWAADDPARDEGVLRDLLAYLKTL